MINKIKVFYLKSSLICNYEINFYKKLANENVFEWIECSEEKLSLQKIKLIDNEKNYLYSIDAFIALWRQLKYLHILAKIISMPVIYNIFCFLYEKHCKKS